MHRSKTWNHLNGFELNIKINHAFRIASNWPVNLFLYVKIIPKSKIPCSVDITDDIVGQVITIQLQFFSIV